MTAPFATSADVAARWRPLSDAESTVADALAADASAIIRARFPGIDSQVVGGTVDPSILVMVVAAMVKRALIAPLDGVSQQTETVGPYSHGETFANPMRNVFILDSELLLIRGYRPSAASFGFANKTIHVEGRGVGSVYGSPDWGDTVNGYAPVSDPVEDGFNGGFGA